jgi:hypothetical protein
MNEPEAAAECGQSVLVAAAPYVGPKPFTELERALFFGREREATQLRNKIISTPLTLLYAPSGVGKTSLLQTLVIPRLRELGLHTVLRDHWFDGDPVQALRDELLESLAGEPGTDGLHACASLLGLARRANEAIDGPIVFILDQFEELLTGRVDGDKVEELYTELGALVRSDVEVHIVLAFRQEFLAGLESFKRRVLTAEQSAFRLGYITNEGARAAIQYPAKQWKDPLEWEPDLVDALLTDLSAKTSDSGEAAAALHAGSIELPFLQILCLRLWEEATARGLERIPLCLYRELGGREGITKSYVQGVIGGLSWRQRRVAADVLGYLAPPSGMKVPCTVEDLAARSLRSEREIASILGHLCRHRVVRDRRVGAQHRFELYHDVFTEVLGDWARAHAGKRRLRKRLLKLVGAGALVISLFATFTWMKMWDAEAKADSAALSAARARAELETAIAKQEAALAKAEVAEAKANQAKADARLEEMQRRERIALAEVSGSRPPGDSTQAVLGPRLEPVGSSRAAAKQQGDSTSPDPTVRQTASSSSTEVADARRDRGMQEASRILLEAAKGGGHVTEMQVNRAAIYLWDLSEQYPGSLDKLKDTLKRIEDSFSAGYGVDARAAGLMPTVGDKEKWPLEVTVHPEAGLDTAQMQHQWRVMASSLASMWGIPAPMRVKITRNEAVGKTAPRITVLPQASGGDEDESEAKIVSELEIPSLAQKALVNKSGTMDPRLSRFVEEYGEPVTQLKKRGDWRLVPRWAWPIVNAAGYEASPPEGAWALLLANHMLERPDLVLTTDCVRVLLSNHLEGYTDTVKAALTARGGVTGVRDVLIAIVRLGHGLRDVAWFLDGMADYPADHHTAEDTARYLCGFAARPDASRLQLVPRTQLSREAVDGQSGDADTPSGDIQKKEDFSHVYSECVRWLDVSWQPIRASFGKEAASRIVEGPDGTLTADVLAATKSVRDELEERYGISVPGVSFLIDGDLPDTTFHLTVCRTGYDPVDLADVADADTSSRFAEEFSQRVTEARGMWPTPEDVDWDLVLMPENQEAWIRSRYTPSDIKLLLRAVVASDSTAKANTISHARWLLGSLVFWDYVARDPHDPRELAQYLVGTQAARLDFAAGKREASRAPPVLTDAVGALADDDVDGARATFGSLKLDRNRRLRTVAVRAFPRLYADALWYRGIARLPGPLKVWSSTPLSPAERQRIVQFLSDSDRRIPEETRQLLRLHELWSYDGHGERERAAQLCARLLREAQDASWKPEYKYFLAFLALRAHRRDAEYPLLPPDRLDLTTSLLASAFHQWAGELRSGKAFEELVKKVYTDTRVPRWYWGMLQTLADADSSTSSFWMPYFLGHHLAQGNEEDARKALEYLDRAEKNIPEGRGQDENRAWVNWARVMAHDNLAMYLRGGDEASRHLERESKLLDGLIGVIPEDAEGWPQVGLLTRYQAALVLLDGRSEENLNRAFDMLKEQAGVPGNEYLHTDLWVIHLARLDMDAALLHLENLPKDVRDGADCRMENAMVHLLTARKGYDRAARDYLSVENQYNDNRDYVRMLLYWTRCREGKQQEANRELAARWDDIKRANARWRRLIEKGNVDAWRERLQQGDLCAWREMLIGYYVGALRREDMYAPFATRESFQQSALSRLSIPLCGFRCELYFYDALLQETKGSPPGLVRDLLKKAIDDGKPSYYEYDMARYLLSKRQ